MSYQSAYKDYTFDLHVQYTINPISRSERFCARLFDRALRRQNLHCPVESGTQDFFVEVRWNLDLAVDGLALGFNLVVT